MFELGYLAYTSVSLCAEGMGVYLSMKNKDNLLAFSVVTSTIFEKMKRER